MEKTDCTIINLEKGLVLDYSFNSIELLVYRTNDSIDNEVIMLIKNNKMVIIESPCFYENINELENFIQSLKVNIAGVILSYHLAGGGFLSKTKKYSSERAYMYGTKGGGKKLIDSFTKNFGKTFDSSLHNVSNFITSTHFTIAEIDLLIKETDDAFDIIVPEINVIYTHMLGHDCHSIIANDQQADAMIDYLMMFKKQKYELVLTSHHNPENMKDVDSKIEYLKSIKNIATKSNNAQEFKESVLANYPTYSGLNYLDITSNLFFPNKE